MDSNHRSATFPSIGLITCADPQVRYLETTIRSVLAQNYRALEYSIVDSNPSHTRVDLIRRYNTYLAYWVSATSCELRSPLTEGFARTRGDIMGWLRSEDLVLPGALHAVGHFFATHPNVSAVYGDALQIDDCGRYLRSKKGISFNRLVSRFNRHVPRPMFWRRSLYDAVGGLSGTPDVAPDYELWERFSRHGTIAHLPRYLCCIRERSPARSDSISDSRTDQRFGFLHSLLSPWARAVRVATKVYNRVYGCHASRDDLAWLQNMIQSNDWLQGRDEFARILWV